MSSSETSPTPPSLSTFVLDENFPQPILAEAVLRKAVRKRVQLEIKMLSDVDAALLGYQDHDLIRALDARGAEGLITCDDAMVFRPEVQKVIQDTGFSVVTCRKAGDDPIRATGLVLVHLREIGQEHSKGHDQIWRLGAAKAKPLSVAQHRRQNS